MVGANVKTNFYIDDIYYTTITQGFLYVVFLLHAQAIFK
jgi:hypothetical protein